MTKPRYIAFVLFAIAIVFYFVAPRVAMGLVVMGLLLEIAGWISLFKRHEDSGEKES